MPLSDRLIVEPQENGDKTPSGIILPETAKEKPQKGKILSIGPGERDEERRFDATEARRAHQAYKRGDRGEWATVGHRVYCRRIARKRAQREDAA